MKGNYMDLTKAIICSAQNKSDHCLNDCFHGVPHIHERERDGNCKNKSHCSLSNAKRAVSVFCKKLNKKQRMEFENES